MGDSHFAKRTSRVYPNPAKKARKILALRRRSPCPFTLSSCPKPSRRPACSACGGMSFAAGGRPRCPMIPSPKPAPGAMTHPVFQTIPPPCASRASTASALGSSERSVPSTSTTASPSPATAPTTLTSATAARSSLNSWSATCGGTALPEMPQMPQMLRSCAWSPRCLCGKGSTIATLPTPRPTWHCCGSWPFTRAAMPPRWIASSASPA